MDYYNYRQEKDRAVFMRFNDIVGYLYLPKGKTSNVLLYANGGPDFGDRGNSPIFWKAALEYHTAVFIPDYLGSSRSGGDTFSMDNCLKTLYESEKFLKGEYKGLDAELMSEFEVKFDNVVLQGGSWGGAIAPFYHKFYGDKTTIKHIGLIAPVTDWTKQGTPEYGDSSMVVHLFQMRELWGNIYRNSFEGDWPDIINGKKPEFNPINELDHLKGLWIKIAHGDADNSVKCVKSKTYYDALVANDTENKNLYFEILKGVTHFEPIEVNGTKSVLEGLKQSSDIVFEVN